MLVSSDIMKSHLRRVSGFAQVIEGWEKLPGNFAQEMIGDLLELNPRLWWRSRTLQNSIPNGNQFADWYKLV